MVGWLHRLLSVKQGAVFKTEARNYIPRDCSWFSENICWIRWDIVVQACNPRIWGAGSMSRRLSAASRRSFRPSWNSETLSYPPRVGKSRLDKQSPMKIYFVIVMWLNPFIMRIMESNLKQKYANGPIARFPTHWHWPASRCPPSFLRPVLCP